MGSSRPCSDTTVEESHVLNHEQLTTVIAKVEAILNNRPLIPLAWDDSSVPFALTLGHFLIGRPLLAPSIRCDHTTPISCLKRWKLTKRITSLFWKAWSSSYLQSLQVKQKWTNSTPNFGVRDLVLLCDDTLAEDRNWPLGIITAVHPGPDDLDRIVEVKVRGKCYTRSIHRLVRLPVSHSVHGGEDVQDSGPAEAEAQAGGVN